MTQNFLLSAEFSSIHTPQPATLRDSHVWTAVQAAQEKKATEITILDIGEITSFADYFILCNGTSTRHVQAVADEIEKKLREERCLPHHIEGSNGAEWVLFDYGDFIVHIFTPQARAFYDLERLWSDAPRIFFNDRNGNPSSTG